MSNQKVETVRKQLLAKLEELTGRSRREELIAERTNDPMDQMQARVDLDMAVLFVNTDFQTKKKVETALGLLNQGEYGTCQECGDPINPKRLEAIPWTTMCIGCQELHDDPEGDNNVRKAA